VVTATGQVKQIAVRSLHQRSLLGYFTSIGYTSVLHAHDQCDVQSVAATAY